MLEAMVNDQGHRRRCFQTKKKIFLGDLKKKGHQKKFWMAQKAINIAANWASEQELQLGSKKTEIVLFTHKRNPDLGSF